MPIVRAGDKIIYYAHVPKCAGSAVEHYLKARFDQIAFVDSAYMGQPQQRRWSRTSPQHISVEALRQLFPADFFDASFSIVRHPVARLVSAYHFQQDLERTIPADQSFSAWLDELAELLNSEPFIYDNHIRPMADLIPEGAQIFHLEHGIDALVPWLDGVTGTKSAPRATPRINEQGSRGTVKVTPTPDDVACIIELYAVDFERFGYRADEKIPSTEPPVLPTDVSAARDAEAARYNAPLKRLRRRLSAVLRG